VLVLDLLVAAAVLALLMVVHGLAHHLAAGRPGRLWHALLPFYNCIDCAVYHPITRGRRLLALAAGTGASYVLLAVLAFAMLVGTGVRTGAQHHVVERVRPDSDASGQLEPGDRLLAIDGQDLAEDAPPLGVLVQASEGRPVTLVIDRRGEQLTMTVTPKFDPDTGYRLGIGFRFDHPRNRGVGAALVPALTYPARRSAEILGGWYTIIRGRERGELSGPVGIIEAGLEVPSFAERFGATLTLALYEALLLLLLDLVMAVVALVRGSQSAHAA